jgi:hypothetical protein
MRRAVPATLKSTRKPARAGGNERVLFPQGQHARGGRSTAPKESSAEAKFRLFGTRLGRPLIARRR